jgi:hypothetical protein
MEWNPEHLFYELMWQIEGRQRRLPLPWWVQQYFRRWSDAYDGGLFPSKEAAFASNALYRYWNMIGVKDRHQECLIGQSGEIEPVYDEYALSFFLFDSTARRIFYPQYPDFSAGQSLRQGWMDGYLPVLLTIWDVAQLGLRLSQVALATTVGLSQKDLVLARLRLEHSGSAAVQPVWLCLALTPTGPTGFRRQDKARHEVGDRRISFLRYDPALRQVLVNRIWGPTFDTAPQHFGVYGNGGPAQPDFYLSVNPYEELLSRGALNGWTTANDINGGYCQAVFAWEVDLGRASPFDLDVRLPIGDYRGEADLQVLRAEPVSKLDQGNRDFWTDKLNKSGLQIGLPGRVNRLFDLFRISRATLLILADDGAIHPGPTIYDSFWIRDSSVEGIGCALAGDLNLPERQFGEHYLRPDVFHQEQGTIPGTSVSIFGFFGRDHERDDREWDSNGEALWALGRFDRIRGRTYGFGSSVFSPFVLEGARWIQRNRSEFGLLHSGWSAEHLGEKEKPHYWDDFWAIAGLWEAAQLATRIGAAQTGELWGIYDEMRSATAASIRWVIDQQRQQGDWETFIPTGPADVGRLDSTMIGATAYFHPCRLHMGAKLGSDIDQYARWTLDTVWAHFVDPAGGFRHDTSWGAYGPYLTLQLAHAFLFTGDVARMDRCLAWTVGNAAYARLRPFSGAAAAWEVAQGVWNEQHCYPVATDFNDLGPPWWYMGDIPHGWAAAEFILLLRDILFFEADEDGDAHVYLAPGIPPHWLTDGQGQGQSIVVGGAPTIFGTTFGYSLQHDPAARSITIDITNPLPANVRFVYPCRLGAGVASVDVDGQPAAVGGPDVQLPAGFTHARVRYR